MAFDQTHPVTQLLCRREPVLTRKFKSLSQKTVTSIADCDTFYLDDTRKAVFQNQNLSRVPWKTKSAKGKLVLVSCFCVHMYKKKGLLDKNAKTIWSAAGVSTPFALHAWDFQPHNKPVFMSRDSGKRSDVYDMKTSLKCSDLFLPFQPCAGCSARMEECASGPTPAPVLKAGWVDFVKSVSSQLTFCSAAGSLRGWTWKVTLEN